MKNNKLIWGIIGTGLIFAVAYYIYILFPVIEALTTNEVNLAIFMLMLAMTLYIITRFYAWVLRRD